MTTHILMTTARVRELCEYRLRRADESRDKDRADLIEANRYPSWRRRLGLKPRTPERSLELLERADRNTMFGGCLADIELRHRWARKDPLRLLHAAQMSAGAIMLVSSEDAKRLHDWAEGLERSKAAE